MAWPAANQTVDEEVVKDNVLKKGCFVLFLFFFDKEMCLRGALLACRVQPSYFISIISCYDLLMLSLTFNYFISELLNSL